MVEETDKDSDGTIRIFTPVFPRQHVGRQGADLTAGQPVLNLIFLGMGEDGHVASLFPGASDEVVRSKSVYVPVVAPKPPPRRITLNLATIAAARQVWVLASGAGKEQALRESLAADGKTPLSRLIRLRQETIIFTDIAT